MPTSLPSSRLAWYALGRFWNANEDGSQVFDAGYFAHLDLEDGEIFVPNQAAGPRSAHFTFFSEPFTITRLQNGPMGVAYDSVGIFSLFYQRHPQGDFTEPTSFAQGQRIASFKRPFMVMTERLGTLEITTFSAELIESMPFEHCGQTYNLRDIVPNGVTQFSVGTGATSEAEPTFSGSAVAVGRLEMLPR